MSTFTGLDREIDIHKADTLRDKINAGLILNGPPDEDNEISIALDFEDWNALLAYISGAKMIWTMAQESNPESLDPREVRGVSSKTCAWVFMNPNPQAGYPTMDITAPEHGVQFHIRRDGEVVWVNVDGVTVLRICQIPKFELTDDRSVS